VVVEGQLRYYDVTVVSMYRKDVRIRMNKSALALGITSKLQKYKAINAQSGHMKVMPLVMDAVGGTNRDLERLSDRIGHWSGARRPADGYTQLGHQHRTNVRARGSGHQGPAGTCAQPSRPESGCTAHGAVKIY
jgi:hypothetical protein